MVTARLQRVRAAWCSWTRAGVEPALPAALSKSRVASPCSHPRSNSGAPEPSPGGQVPGATIPGSQQPAQAVGHGQHSPSHQPQPRRARAQGWKRGSHSAEPLQGPGCRQANTWGLGCRAGAHTAPELSGRQGEQPKPPQLCGSPRELCQRLLQAGRQSRHSRQPGNQVPCGTVWGEEVLHLVLGTETPCSNSPTGDVGRTCWEPQLWGRGNLAQG